jgi:prepilin-type N-terminal cleavage/methylation domain-containing protein
MRKKRAFALLELLIALALVALLSVYLIREPMHQLKKEMEALIDLEAERLWLVKLMEQRKALPEEWEAYKKKEDAEWMPVQLEVVIPIDVAAKKTIGKTINTQYKRWKADGKDGPEGTKHLRLRYKFDKGRGKPKPEYDLYFETPKK